MIDPPDIPEGGKVIGVGIDQIEVSRIRDSLDQHGSSFLDKIFTLAEQASARTSPTRLPIPPLCRHSRGQGIRDRLNGEFGGSMRVNHGLRANTELQPKEGRCFLRRAGPMPWSA